MSVELARRFRYSESFGRFLLYRMYDPKREGVDGGLFERAMGRLRETFQGSCSEDEDTRPPEIRAIAAAVLLDGNYILQEGGYLFWFDCPEDAFLPAVFVTREVTGRSEF